MSRIFKNGIINKLMNENKNNISKEILIPVFNLIKSKKYDEALNLLESLFNQVKEKSFIDKTKGLIYLKKKDWIKSLKYFKKISEEKMDYEIFNNMGVALYKIGKFSEASIKFRESINSKNKYIPAYENFCVTSKLLGNYEDSVDFSLKALELMPDNNKIKNNLIDILNYFEPKKKENVILKVNNQIKDLNFKNLETKLISDAQINKILNKSENILKKNNFTFNYPHTQIFKKNLKNLNCERHLSLFSKHKIIPKFCFSCYKVQVTMNDVLSLLKLYFYFNKLTLKENNIKKCIIELRSNVIGNYKGYIFCSSKIEAENIKQIISKDLSNKRINLGKIEIKHGCTEYYEEFEVYKNINEDLTNTLYQPKWADIEKKFDEINFIHENIKERVFSETICLFNLPDYLIIKNWLIYAKLIGDNSYKEIFESKVKTDHLSEYEIQKIIMRKNN